MLKRSRIMFLRRVHQQHQRVHPHKQLSQLLHSLQLPLHLPQPQLLRLLAAQAECSPVLLRRNSPQRVASTWAT